MSSKQHTNVGKKVMKNAKNVLAIPKQAFWPTVEEVDCSSLLNLLKEDLKHAKTICPQFTWAEMRKLSKEERKNKIKDFYENLPIESTALHQKALNLKKDLTIGVNEVCRGLEKNKLACCLISGDVKPKLLVSHIVELCKTKEIPVLIVDSLKENIKESLGFKCLAIGFKKEVIAEPNHEMNVLCNTIIHLFNKRYSYDVLTGLNISTNDENSFKPMIEGFIDDKRVEEKHPLMASPEINLNDIYLFRESNKYRVFRPHVPNLPSRETEGFTVFSDMGAEMEIDKNGDDDEIVFKRGRYYEAPTINRVQSNPQKHKKKKKRKTKTVKALL